jgi:ABC-type multidrug transport system permease subunit
MSLSSSLAFVAVAVGVLILVYALGALVVVLFLRRVTRQDNVLSITRRRAGLPGSIADPRYDPRQFRAKR